jgi:hypothetical protein
VVKLEVFALAYAFLGVLVALRCLQRGERPLDAALVLLAWPLYVPLWHRTEPLPDPVSRAADHVRDALSSVETAAAGTPFSGLLDARAGLRLREELARATQRVRAIDDELAREAQRTPASSATVHLHSESHSSLRAIRERDLSAMNELTGLLAALRSRIVLAQHAGSSSEGPEAMVTEVWSRIVGLGEAMEGAGRAPRPRDVERSASGGASIGE